MNNKYTSLLTFLANATSDEFKKFLEQVDPRKLNFFCLASGLCGGSHNVTSRCEELILMMPEELYDVDALLYSCTQDHRAQNRVARILEKVPPHKHEGQGLEAFKTSSDNLVA